MQFATGDLGPARVDLAVGSELYRALDRRYRRLAPLPYRSNRSDLSHATCLGRAAGDGVAHRLDGQHVPRVAVRGGAIKAQPLALADREAEGALVRAEHSPVGVHDLARGRAELPGQEALGVAVGDKADVMTVRLVRYQQAAL